MDLFDRVLPASDEHAAQIPIHSICAAIIDYATGNTTRQSIIDFWVMDSEAQADLNALCDHIDSQAGLAKIAFGLELESVMVIAHAGVKYTTKEAFKTRLGIGV